MNKANILLVEDESIVALDIQHRLKALGYGIAGHIMKGEDVLKTAEELSPDVILMDIKLKGNVDGIEAALSLRELLHIPVIYMTAYSDQHTLERAKLTEPFGYILKPFQEKEIHSTIEMCLYRHRMEVKLRKALETAENSSRAKTEFLKTMSHELKTPLNNILGMTQLALDSEDKAGRDQFLGLVKESAYTLLYQINSLLDFPTLESGTIQAQNTKFCILETIKEALALVSVKMATKGIEAILDIDSNFDGRIESDKPKIHHIFLSLIDTSLKYTESGYIKIQISGTDCDETMQKAGVVCSISDSGIRIEKNEIDQIFSGDKKLEECLYLRIHGGTGLSLSLVKAYIDSLGGYIKMSEDSGAGNNFIFFIPDSSSF